MNAHSIRTLPAAALAIVLVACGSTEPEVTASAPLDRVWRATEAGVSETVLELNAGGTARLVEADLAGRGCTASSGSWTSDGTSLVLRLTPRGGAPESDVRTFDYDVSNDRLVLSRAGTSTTFARGSSVPSCVSYGFGSWQGTLSARIDDVSWTFSNFTVDAEGVRGGTLVIVACSDAAVGCDPTNAVMILRVTTPSGGLTPGSYPLGTIDSGFYGLVNLFPDDPDFPGFDSLRLTPSGAMLLIDAAEDRIEATFEFRANERASNAPPAPDGSTFALVTNGVINLEYR